MTDYKYIKKDDLPRHIFESSKLSINMSTIAINGHFSDNKPIRGAYGSGTLVRLNNIYGILTARHVWNSFEKDNEIEVLSISVYGNEKITLERKNHFRAFLPDEEQDICFLEIPVTIVGWLKANAFFFPLKHGPLYKSLETNLIVLTGFPFVGLPTDKILFRILHFFIDYKYKTILSDEWDVIELEVDYNKNENLLKTYIGVSGGGVWGFRIFHQDPFGNRGHYFKDEETYIAGVNFFQTKVINNVRHIKAMGPRSIYNGLYNYVINSR